MLDGKYPATGDIESFCTEGRTCSELGGVVKNLCSLSHSAAWTWNKGALEPDFDYRWNF
jgi:hypothetical protein